MSSNENEGPFDRTVRIILGLVLIACIFVGPKTPWGVLGVVPLVTGFMGFCPVYRLFKISTT